MSLRHEAWPGILSEFSSFFRPPEQIACSDWNEKYRHLPNGLPFRCWPWQREILDAPSEPDVGEIVLMMPSQVVGKSELLMGILMHQVVCRPADYLLVLPSLPQCERWSRTRFANTVKWSPVLQALLPGEGKRTLASSGSKLLFKSFTNGATLAIATANSAAALAAASICGLFADETDLWKRELLNEGSPFSLAARRLTSFAESLFVQASSPTISSESHIEEEYARSDRRSWLIPCPSCGHSFELRWANVKWPKTEAGKQKFDQAKIECPACATLHDDATRRLMVLNGHWAPADPEQKRVRGYWMSGFNVLLPTRKGYVSRLHEQAVEFWQARKSPTTLSPWINTVCGETFEREKVKPVPIEYLLDRREAYFGDVLAPDQVTVTLPPNVLVLTAGVDVQQRHIESLIIGWTRDKSSFVIDHRSWLGNPALAETWASLGLYLLTPWKLAGGLEILPALVLIDSGYLSSPVHEFCASHPRPPCWPSKGYASTALPWTERRITGGKRYIQVHTDSGKFLFYSRLALSDPVQAGYLHLHIGLDAEFCRQLTSEVVIENKRSRRLTFRKLEDAKNEALDMYVLAMAAEEVCKFNYELLERQRGMSKASTESAPADIPGKQEGKRTSPQQRPRFTYGL